MLGFEIEIPTPSTTASVKGFCNENNIILTGYYSNAKTINSFAIIEGKCINNDCDFNFKKEFRSLIRTNGYCIECTKINAKNKLKITWFTKYGV